VAPVDHEPVPWKSANAISCRAMRGHAATVERASARAVRCVCTSCNNEWMSNLESEAKPVLQPMLAGQRNRLDAASQATIAVWSLKTAMVLEAVESPAERAYTQTERECLRSVGAIPQRTTVWLAASAEASWFMSGKVRHEGAATAVSITMVFAHLAIQVFTLRLPQDTDPQIRVTTDVRRGPWDQATVRVWPLQCTSANWPPSLGLSGECGLDTLAERFKVGTGDQIETDTLAL
jgi:hypothetical protein